MKRTTSLRRVPTAGPPIALMLRASVVILALILVPELASRPSHAAESISDSRLAVLQIEIWPEFDRPAALVILRGELATEVVLPTAVVIRIPASSGGPTAVAAASGPRAGLFNLEYDLSDAGNSITLSFEAPQRWFQVEFYEPLGIDATERSYTYIWPGDFAVDELSVTIQEPAGASDLSVDPNLDISGADPRGLHYRSANMGAWGAGTPLPITITYTKTVSRTSDGMLDAATSPPTRPLTTESIDHSFDGWAPSLAFIIVLVIGMGATLLRRQRHEQAADGRFPKSGFCSQCGMQGMAGARFCSTCGAPLQTNNT